MFRSMLRQRWAVPLRRTGARAYYESLMHEPFAAVPGRTPRWASSAKEAVEVQGIRSGTNIYIHSAAATPTRLVRAVTDYGVANQLRDIRLVHIHTEGEAPFLEEEARKTFRSTSLFTGPNVRKAIAEGQADYVPVFLSETPLLFRNRVIPLQAALVQVSPPDRHGYCSLGVSVDCSRAAVQAAGAAVPAPFPPAHAPTRPHAPPQTSSSRRSTSTCPAPTATAWSTFRTLTPCSSVRRRRRQPPPGHCTGEPDGASAQATSRSTPTSRAGAPRRRSRSAS